MSKVITNSVSETENIGEALAKTLKSGDTVAMCGGLGAGKTAFVRGVARYLCPDVIVTSPTFTIMLEYEGKMPLRHFDMYRISSFDDLYNIGFFDALEQEGVNIIEWSENIPFGLPDRYTKVTITDLGGGKREIITEEVK